MALILRILIFGLLIFLGARLVRKALYSRVAQKNRDSLFKESNSTKSPYEVLGVSSNATPDQIKQAYREALAKYHPDKVDHLGEDLQKLAREKTAAINEAYEAIKST